MFIVMGANGHVGGATLAALLEAGEAVLAVTHDPAHVETLQARGAEAAVVDVTDVEALRAVFRRGRRALILNPPAAPDTDTDAVEEAQVRAIVEAVKGSGLEKLVVASTGGAQEGEALGDLSVLYHLEQGVLAAGAPAAIDRGAYYFSNFEPLLPTIRKGELPSMFPADLALPMIAPADLGQVAARRLRSGTDDVAVIEIEGPRRYSFNDVAAIFAAALKRPVTVKVTPRDGIEAAFRGQGFSEAGARAYARMTKATIDSELPSADASERGHTTLERYVEDLVRAA